MISTVEPQVILFFVILSFFLQVYDYSVVCIKRTGSLNYFEGFYHPDCFFHVLNEFFLPPCSFFHVLNKNFAPPCSLIRSCSLNRYYRVCECSLSNNENFTFWKKVPNDHIKVFICILADFVKHWRPEKTIWSENIFSS